VFNDADFVMNEERIDVIDDIELVPIFLRKPRDIKEVIFDSACVHNTIEELETISSGLKDVCRDEIIDANTVLDGS